MNSFKHSGAFGDLIYSLPIVKHLGGGDFFLHLNQINWIGQYYYNSPPNLFHKDRLTLEDFVYMEDFMLAQDYITTFNVLDPKTSMINFDLDRFRKPFVNHPGNYVDIYSDVFKITDPTEKTTIRTTPWITVPTKNKVASLVVNRTERWIATQIPKEWKQTIEESSSSVFIGLPHEHEKFEKDLGIKIDYYPTKTLLEVASVIAGSDLFIGNQSSGLAVAIGLGVPFNCELRRDLPKERNECYFHNQPNGHYF